MAFTFSTALRSGRANAIQTDLGSGSKLQIWTTGYATKLAEWTWSAAAFPATATGVLTMNAPTAAAVSPLANGTAAIARHTKSDGTTVSVLDLTVGTSAANVIVSNLVFATTSPVTLADYTITEAP